MAFVKGQSGNPSGRPRGFAGVAAAIMRETNDGRELVDFALELLRQTDAKMSDRLAAHAWLSDRALGKPLASLEIGMPGAFEHVRRDWSKVPIDERRALLTQLKNAGRVIDTDGNRVADPKVTDEQRALSPAVVAHAVDVPDEE